MAYLVSIDPGLVTSGTGITLWKDEVPVKTIYCSPRKNKTVTLHDIVEPVIQEIANLVAGLTEVPSVVVEESFYPGKANKMHQRFIGVLQYHIPQLEFIAPLSVKKWVTGSGKADKDMVKAALMELYPDSTVINWESNDVVDSVAIGLAWRRKCGNI